MNRADWKAWKEANEEDEARDREWAAANKADEKIIEKEVANGRPN